MSEEKIQAYVFGELSAGEAAVVAQAIARDAELRERERRYTLIREGFRQERVAGLREALVTYDDTLPPPTNSAPASPPATPPPRSWLRRWWPFLVIGVAGLLVAAYFIERDPAPTLANLYYIPPPQPSVAGAETTELAYQAATENFFSGDYETARIGFNGLLRAQTGYASSALFYLPHASFKLGEFELAAEQYASALTDDNQPVSRQNLLRWNAMINRLARGENIILELGGTWPANYPVKDLRRDLEDNQ